MIRTPPTTTLPGKNVTTDTLLNKSKSSNRIYIFLTTLIIILLSTVFSFFSILINFFFCFFEFSLFKECPHPDEKQRLELSRRLCLETRQVKFWFQNRRTQMKVNIHSFVQYSLFFSLIFLFFYFYFLSPDPAGTARELASEAR